MQSSVTNMSESYTSVTICDLDRTELTTNIIQSLEDIGYKVDKVELTGTPNDFYISQASSSKNVLVIPQGFTQSIENGEVATLTNVGKVEGNSIMAQLEGGVYTTAITDISDIVTQLLLEDKSTLNADELEFVNSPVTLDEVTIVGDKSAEVSASTISSMVSSQGTFVPIIIFLIIVMASQMIVTAISTEKIDKTLETLLSTPISRVSILTAKMLSAGLVSLISALVYMLGFVISMGSLMLNASDYVTDATDISMDSQVAMLKLGLVLMPTDYVLIGLDIFLSIMIALSISMMLGVLVNDVKSTQIVVMPVMFMAMIPYLISYFADINTLSPVVKLLLNLIPFTHTFNATNNLLFGETSDVIFGIVYQVVLLVVCLFGAVKLFQSDKILTASLNFGNRKKV
jgi:ABC-2 type transport system permease protein